MRMTTLQEEANKRRERMKAFHSQRDKLESENEEKKQKIDADEPSIPKPFFRNYKPTDEKLKERVLEPAKPVEIKDQVKDQLEEARQTNVVEEVGLVNLAPRKPDWDLKRNISKQCEKLEHRTQRAYAELIRDRLKQNAMKSEEIAASLSFISD